LMKLLKLTALGWIWTIMVKLCRMGDTNHMNENC
jgi:hypothetical protein